jgi:hypothetical protein
MFLLKPIAGLTCRASIAPFFDRNASDLALVDEFDIAKTIQQHQMTSADQGVLPALYWAHGPIISRNRKRDERIGAKQLLYLVNHWHP